uniref:Fibronectin type III domain containing 7, related sequence 3 n=1 Tax=Cynoglossus semilaevis TaxID=244447 RepID=A0A3P8WUB9_CYNSE
VTVSWEPSLGAIVYDVFAQGNAGYASTCNSTETTCTFQDLLCGLTYSITVSASDDTCPCVAQQVEAVMVCSNDTGVVSWEE